MIENTCPSCNKELQADFRFCPYCGEALNKPIICPKCNHTNESDSKFCRQCGTQLHDKTTPKETMKSSAAESKSPIGEIEAPPRTGITIEFPYSSAQSFHFAVESAKRFESFIQYGEDKKAIYRVNFQPHEMENAIELIGHLKGWRRRTVYVDGEKVTWDSVFSFTWCYEKKKASFKPDLYCFGYENDYEFNVWGCIRANLPFRENEDWFCWGEWVNNRGDWKFDKERIRHELEKRLYNFRYCPALQNGFIDDVLNSLPDVVNPSKDKNWKFAESWGSEPAQGLVVTVDRYGIKEKVVMKGVYPNGRGALNDLDRRIKSRLPKPR